MKRVGVVVLVLVTVVFGVAAPASSVPPEGTVQVPSVLETVPTGVAGDTADDPAIWPNPVQRWRSLVVTNEKAVGRLTVFNLAGKVVQRITQPTGFYGNVDVRGDLVAASNAGVWTWRVTETPSGPRLVPAREATGNAQTAGEGLCLWDPGAPGVLGGLYAINLHRTQFRVRVHPLTDADNDGLLLVGPPVRDFLIGSEGEGCEVDDAAGNCTCPRRTSGSGGSISPLPPDQSFPGVIFAPVSPELSPDIEGLALAGGVLYASSQNVAAPRFNWITRYDAATGTYLGSSRIVDGTASDDCDQTDGLDAYAGYLGPKFPSGLFVCQDGFNELPGTSGTQNFKFAPLGLLDDGA